MEDNDLEYLKGVEKQRDEAIAKTTQMSTATSSMFGGHGDPNLIEWQLELDNILERVEHLLKGETLIQQGEHLIWQAAPDEADRPLNTFGVQFLMNTLSFYLNRNTILSNYDEKRIKQILYDIGYELTDQIYLNAEKMGLDTPDKQKRYAIIVLQIVHSIESAYNRAFRGEERESLRTARVVTQADNLHAPSMFSPPAQKKTSLFNPSTWFRG